MKARLIKCPKCARDIGVYDGRTTMIRTYRCECGRYFRYDPRVNSLEQTEKPERTTSSGVRFY